MMSKHIFLLSTLLSTYFASHTAVALSPFEKYEGSKKEERKLIDELAKKFTKLQSANAQAGKKLRGTHAKGTCVDAQLEVYDLHGTNYDVGLFAKPAVYEARARFANGAGTINADSTPDARALSVAVYTHDGRRQDFAMNNGPVFPIGDLESFNFILDLGFIKGKAVQDALARGLSQAAAEAAGKLAAASYMAWNPQWLATFTRMTTLGAALQNQDVRSYRDIKYWSGSAFKYGEEEVAKFAFTPCTSVNERLVDKSDPDYLQNDLKDAITNDSEEVCFELQVQKLVAEKMRYQGYFSQSKLPAWQWVEDPTLDWDEAGATFFTVGKLTIKPFSVYEQERCDHPDNGFDVMRHALPEHLGLGRINRGRSRSEKVSQDNR